MDYFKRAASAVLSSAAGPFPGYTLGEREPWLGNRTLWTQHAGTRREDGAPVSILSFDAAAAPNRRNLLPLAKNALRKLRTMRHPDVLRLLDSHETPTAVWIAVERVRPLGKAMEEMGRVKGREEWISWGLRSVSSALSFINDSAGSTHGNIRLDSVFLASSGEWRLGGFEVLSAPADEAAVLYNMGSLLPDAARFAPPEVKLGGWSPLKGLEPHVLDSYSFALLILEAYNGPLPPIVGNAVPAAGLVPAPIYALVRRMMVPNAKARLTPKAFLAAGETPGSFFAENRLVRIAAGLENFVLAREEERAEVMRQLKNDADSLPPDFLQYKVLPALTNALSLSSGAQTLGSSTLQASKILPLVLQLGSKLADSDWVATLQAPLLAAYKSPDRGVRMALLEHLELYSARLEQKRVVDGVWPNLITGFADTAPAIREATIRAILPLAPKLSERILNNDLLRQLAKTQIDTEPGIRTNTTILLGRLSESLTLHTRRTVLVPAFARSLKDPFVHARMAGLMALMATGESYERDDMARLILPALAPCLVDKEKIVRDQAKQGMSLFLKRIEEAVASMPDSVLPPVDETLQAPGALSSLSSDGRAPEVAASTSGGAASALAGWTLSAFARTIDGAAGASGALDGGPRVASPPALGTAHAPRASAAAASSPLRPSSTVSASSSAALGSMDDDLIDINDDADDWSSFEVGTKKPSEVPRRIVPRAKPLANRVPSSSRLGAVRTAEPTSAIARSSLAVKDVAADEAAWDSPDEAAASPSPLAVSHPGTGASTPSGGASTTAAFFAAPIPGALEEPEPAESWGAIDDAEPEETKPAQSEAALPPAGASKEERKAELEKLKAQRRARMAALKESRAAKLGNSLA